MSSYTKIISIMFVTVLTSTAQAQNMGVYVGGSLGMSNLDEDDESLQEELASGGFTGTATVDDSDLGWKLFGGYMFNQYFSAEASYLDLGEVSGDFNITAPEVLGGSASVKVDGFAISGIASYPVSEQFGIFAKGGVFIWNSEGELTIDGFGAFSDDSLEDDGTGLLLGIGLRFDFAENVSLRAEWEYFPDISEDSNDVQLFSAGILYRF